jgi:N utilization substance protein B
MYRRSRAREIAFQVLYQDDLNSRGNPAEGDRFIERRLRGDDLIAFAKELVAGVRRHREATDALLEQFAANWSVRRMAATDRNVLRLGAYELLHTDTPPKVAIDEAVELAKRFGSAQSSQFVNGILDRMMQEKEKVVSGQWPVVGATPPQASDAKSTPTEPPLPISTPEP